MHEDRLHREAQVEAEHQLADVVPPAALSVESVLEMDRRFGQGRSSAVRKMQYTQYPTLHLLAKNNAKCAKTCLNHPKILRLSAISQ